MHLNKSSNIYVSVIVVLWVEVVQGKFTLRKKRKRNHKKRPLKWIITNKLRLSGLNEALHEGHFRLDKLTFTVSLKKWQR